MSCIYLLPRSVTALATTSGTNGPRPTLRGEVDMRKVFSTGIVLSALLAWSALSVGQSTTPAQPAGTAAAGQTAGGAVVAADTGTVVGGGVLGTGLAATEAAVLGLVAVGTIAAVANTDNTTPQTP